jgi:hypothetical protein
MADRNKSKRKTSRQETTDPTIEIVRLTFISIETLPQLFTGGSVTPPFEGLNSNSKFKRLFDLARRGAAQFGLKPPWPRPEGQRFWSTYLDDNLTGSGAWNGFVPLRILLNDQIKASLRNGDSMLSEAFYYPFGSAIMSTFRLKGPGSLSEVVDEAYRLRNERVFVFSASNPAQTIDYDRLVGDGFDWLRVQLLGSGAARGVRGDKPFSIFTVIRTQHCPETRVDPNSDLHRALAAVADWPTYWKETPPSDLATATLRIKRSPPSHLLYGGSHGRSVWFPASFANPQNKSSLSCYHRNLAMASLQTASLAGVLRCGTAELTRSGELKEPLRDMTRAAAGLLSRMYVADEQKSRIYRTASVQAQIRQLGLVAEINQIRSHFTMPGPPLT